VEVTDFETKHENHRRWGLFLVLTEKVVLEVMGKQDDCERNHVCNSNMIIINIKKIIVFS
jgi:hypothetical protein